MVSSVTVAASEIMTF